MKRAAAVATATFLTLLSASVAAADKTPWPRAQHSRAGLEWDIWPYKQQFTFPGGSFEYKAIAMGWCGFGQIGVVDNVFIDFEVPWAYWTVWNDDGSNEGGAFGNLTAGAHYAALITKDIGFWAGGTLSVPTHLMDVGGVDENGVPEDLEEQAAAAGAVSARAGLDIHRFFPEHISLLARGGIEIRFVDFMYYRGSLEPGFHIPVDGKFELYMDQINELEARADIGVGGGLRIQEVFFWTDSDLIQTAVEPFFGYEPPGAGFIFRLGFMLALDRTLGFGFDHGKVASFRTMFGGKW